MREEVDAREGWYGGPQGAELGTVTSVKWSVERTSQLPGDFLLISFVICLSFFLVKLYFAKISYRILLPAWFTTASTVIYMDPNFSVYWV